MSTAIQLTGNQALIDELEAVNSIYGDSTLEIVPGGDHDDLDNGVFHPGGDIGIEKTVAKKPLTLDQSNNSHILSPGVKAVLRVPDLSFSFSILFPDDYPDAPPQVLGVRSTGPSAKRGEGESIAGVLRQVLGAIFVPGQVCLFDLIEEAGPLLAQEHEATSSIVGLDLPTATKSAREGRTSNGEAQDGIRAQNTPNRSEPPSTISVSQQSLAEQATTLGIQESYLSAPSLAATSSMPPPNWSISETLVVNRSTFVGRALSVSSLAEATESIGHLLATNKKVAGATHNITAWRIKQSTGTASSLSNSKAAAAATTAPGKVATEVVIQDCDDDGESAAGGRLLHLMQLMDVWNVVVVVTRWYGGVKLGPDRFRCINSVGREALVNGKFVNNDESMKTKAKGKKK